jgi:hypothetical protein
VARLFAYVTAVLNHELLVLLVNAELVEMKRVAHIPQSGSLDVGVALYYASRAIVLAEKFCCRPAV